MKKQNLDFTFLSFKKSCQRLTINAWKNCVWKKAHFGNFDFISTCFDLKQWIIGRYAHAILLVYLQQKMSNVCHLFYCTLCMFTTKNVSAWNFQNLGFLESMFKYRQYKRPKSVFYLNTIEWGLLRDHFRPLDNNTYYSWQDAFKNLFLNTLLFKLFLIILSHFQSC